MANQWFYAKDGQKFGPVTGKRLKELAQIGVVRRNDLIWSPGYSVWRPAKKFRGLLPKMDATSFNPAMSLFWRPGDLASDDEKLQGLLLEPNAPETAITPPLPSGYTHVAPGPVPALARGGISSPPRPPASRPSARGPIQAALSESAGASTTSPTVVRLPAPVPVRPGVAAAAGAKAKRDAMSLRETLAIGGGIVVLSLIYVVVLLRVL